MLLYINWIVYQKRIDCIHIKNKKIKKIIQINEIKQILYLNDSFTISQIKY